jgi:hypothetical protein
MRGKIVHNISAFKLKGGERLSNVENNISKELLHEYMQDKILFPKSKISIMLIAYVFMIIISLLKGSGKTPSLINIER